MAFNAAVGWLLAAAAWATVPGQAAMQDPTRPLRAEAAPAADARQGEPTLDSVLIGEARRVAVINGRRMTEGQEWAGIKVRKIRPDGVVVSVNGAPAVTLRLANSRMHKELQ